MATADEDRRERQREKARAYYQANKDRIKARQKISDAKKYLRDKERINARRMAWTAANREKQKEVDRRYYWNNVERKRAEKREDYQQDPEKFMARSIAYAAANPEKVRIWRKTINANRRSKGFSGRVSVRDFSRLMLLQKGKCAYCRVKLGKGAHLDHIKALAKGGRHEPTNVQLLCRRCNQAKGVKDALVFSRELGMLL